MTDQPGIMFPRIKLSHFHKLINLTMSRLFKSYGCDITREQEVILRELRLRDGVNQVELAVRTEQDRNNLSRTLVILESKNLIARDRSHRDKRNSLVYLTDSGRALHEVAYQAINEYRRVLFQGFSQKEVDTFADMIHRLSDNLSDFLEENGAAKDAGDDGEEEADGTRAAS